MAVVVITGPPSQAAAVNICHMSLWDRVALDSATLAERPMCPEDLFIAWLRDAAALHGRDRIRAALDFLGFALR